MANKAVLTLLGQPKQLTLGPLIRGSGIPVPCYPDVRGILSYPKNLKIMAQECAKLIAQWKDIDCIAGCAMGGVALATALSLESGKPFILLRKTPRLYGPHSAIDGKYKKGQRVLLIDDSIVTGTSKRPYVDHLLQAKLRPIRFLTIIDVGAGFPLWQKQRHWMHEHGVELHALATWTEWALYMRDRGRIPRTTVATILRLMDNPPQWAEGEVDAKEI
ncbi:MAG: phosphoribosyltransferase family protein [bacterium]|nr:phosphoribosyltransferase family protein [bacterium]